MCKYSQNTQQQIIRQPRILDPLPVPAMSFEIKGMPSLDFYHGTDILPQSFFSNQDISESKLVAICSATSFFKIVNQKSIQRFNRVDSGYHDPKNKNDCQIWFKEGDMSEQNLAKNNDFVVYLFK